LASIYEGSKERLKAIQTLYELLQDSTPTSSDAWLPSKSNDQLSELWERLTSIQELHDSETIVTEVEKRRKRLGADTAAVTKMKVEKEVLMASKVIQCFLSYPLKASS
jgi:hypothetical protein